MMGRMEPLEEIYKEGKVKTASRKKIVHSALQLALLGSIESLSMQAVANKAGITLRNLYRYYDNKDLLIVDVIYYVISHFSVDTDFPPINTSHSGLDLLRSLLCRFYVENPVRYEDEELEVDEIAVYKLVNNFDYYLLTLDESNPAYQRYVSFYMKTENTFLNDYIDSLLEKGIEDGSIRIPQREIVLYRELITQSMMGLRDRVLLKEHEQKTVNMALLWKNVDMIIAYLER